MNRLDTVVRRHPIAFAFVVVILFLALLEGPAALFDGKSDYIVEGFGALQRAIIAALALLLIRALGWLDVAGVSKSGDRHAWSMILVPFIYLSVVFPYLFTHSWMPNLRDPALTALAGVDAFAEGALEEFIFRGLI